MIRPSVFSVASAKVITALFILCPLFSCGVLSPSTPRRGLFPALKCLNFPAFVGTHLPSGARCRVIPLNSGWGVTNNYSWKEDDDYVIVSSSLGRGLSPSDITVDLAKDSIKVQKCEHPAPIIEGRTKGRVDVDKSCWTLEETNGVSELQITLKKSEPYKQEWFGVLVDEQIQLKDYRGDTGPGETAKPNSVEPNEIYAKKYFRNLDAQKIGDMFHKWMNRESNDMAPFGRPKTDIDFRLLSEESGDKILFVGVDQDEYMNVVTKTAEDDPKSSELVLVNGPQTSILQGLQGTELRDRLQRSLNTLIASFEREANNLNSVMTATPTAKAGFDYAGCDANLGLDNINEYVEYHKSLEAIMKEHREKQRPESEADKQKLREKEEELKRGFMKITEGINITEHKQPREKIGTIVGNLKKNLGLDAIQMNDLFRWVRTQPQERSRTPEPAGRPIEGAGGSGDQGGAYQRVVPGPDGARNYNR